MKDQVLDIIHSLSEAQKQWQLSQETKTPQDNSQGVLTLFITKPMVVRRWVTFFLTFK